MNHAHGENDLGYSSEGFRHNGRVERCWLSRGVLARRGSSNILLLGKWWLKTGVLGDPFPSLQFAVKSLTLLLELVIRGTQLGDGLLRKQFLECPFLDVLLLVFLQLGNEADSPLQDRTLVLLASRNNLG